MGITFKISKIGRKFGQRVSTESRDPNSPEHLNNPKAIVLSGKSKSDQTGTVVDIVAEYGKPRHPFVSGSTVESAP